MIAKSELQDSADKISDFSSRKQSSTADLAATATEVADYIADLLQELQELSQASGQAQLSLLLELAQREARRTSLRAISINRAPLPPQTPPMAG